MPSTAHAPRSWLTAWSFRPSTTTRPLFKRGRNASDRGTSPLTRFLPLSRIRAYSPPAQRPLSVVGAKRSISPRDPRPQSPAKVGPDPTGANSTSTCHALIDTGATTTMIVEEVAEALDLDLDGLNTVEVRKFDGRVVGNHPATDSLWVSAPPFDPATHPEVVIVPNNILNHQAIVAMDCRKHFEIAVRHGTFGQI